MLIFQPYVALMISLAMLSRLASGDVCLLMYQLADNDLEYFIRQDNYELSVSSVIRNPTLTTWMYFDHRNFKGTNDDIDEPLRNVFQSDGSAVTGTKTTLSQYLRWDHGLGKLVIDRTLPTEQDGDDPATITQFMVTAMQDCIVKGSTEFFVVFASHGGGFDGFGNDENTRKRRHRRRLVAQTNEGIASALRSALNQVSGAPNKFDVIGFDACLMQAVGAADDYRSVGKYLLASEAVEAGHGWAYDLLTEGGTALGLAREIQYTFLESKHGLSTHSIPKTLAIVDLDKYDVFLSNWDSLSAELRSLLVSNDPEVYTQMNRARNAAIAFESVVDDVGTNGPSAADVGSFLDIFAKGCVPSPGSTLDVLLSNAQRAYADMFLDRGVGEGTPQATGMHILWPVRREFAAYQPFYEEKLFNTNLPYATAAAPEWLKLLKNFYSATTPPSGGASVCTLGIETVVQPEPGQLLIGPRLSGIQNGGHLLTTEIAREVDEVYVDYGVDFTSSELIRGRKLFSSRRVEGESAWNINNSTSILSNSGTNGAHIFKHRLWGDRIARRRLQQSQEEYLLVFGGSLVGTYDQASFSAFWDRTFFLFEDTSTANQFLNFYAFDNGGSQKSTPIIYMPPDNPITSETIRQAPLGIGELDFIRSYGGQFGKLSFNSEGYNGQIRSDSVTLFTNDGSSLSETPRTAGGQIIPVQIVEGYIDGVEVSVLVGGISATVLDWNADFSIRIATADFCLEQLRLDKLVVDVVAADDDALLRNDLRNGIDFVAFYIAKDGSTSLVTYGDGQSSSGKWNPSKERWQAVALLVLALSTL